MKKLFLFLTVTMSVLTIFSCSTDEASSLKARRSNPYDLSLKARRLNPYDFIGQLHNEALDYIYNSKMRGEISDMGDEYVDELREVMENNCYNYLSQTLKNDERFSIDDYYQADDDEDITNAMSDAFNSVETTSCVPFADDQTSVNSLIDNMNISLTAKNDLKEMYSQFDVLPDNLLYSYLVNKEQSILSGTYSETDQRVLLPVISIGKYSIDFWVDPTSPSSGSWGKIGRADLVGAARGIWSGRFVIAACCIGGAAGGLAAAARYAFLHGVAGSAVYAFIEGGICDKVKADDEKPVKGDDMPIDKMDSLVFNP